MLPVVHRLDMRSQQMGSRKDWPSIICGEMYLSRHHYFLSTERLHLLLEYLPVRSSYALRAYSAGTYTR